MGVKGLKTFYFSTHIIDSADKTTFSFKTHVQNQFLKKLTPLNQTWGLSEDDGQKCITKFYTGEDRTKNPTVDKNISFSFSWDENRYFK